MPSAGVRVASLLISAPALGKAAAPAVHARSVSLPALRPLRPAALAPLVNAAWPPFRRTRCARKRGEARKARRVQRFPPAHGAAPRASPGNWRKERANCRVKACARPRAALRVTRRKAARDAPDYKKQKPLSLRGPRAPGPPFCFASRLPLVALSKLKRGRKRSGAVHEIVFPFHSSSTGRVKVVTSGVQAGAAWCLHLDTTRAVIPRKGKTKKCLLQTSGQTAYGSATMKPAIRPNTKRSHCGAKAVSKLHHFQCSFLVSNIYFGHPQSPVFTRVKPSSRDYAECQQTPVTCWTPAGHQLCL
jgi:hypothetical protein